MSQRCTSSDPHPRGGQADNRPTGGQMTIDAPTSVREEAERWFRESRDPELTLGQWWERLTERGWGYPTWPKRWFAKGLSSDQAKQVGPARAPAAAPDPGRPPRRGR